MARTLSEIHCANAKREKTEALRRDIAADAIKRIKANSAAIEIALLAIQRDVALLATEDAAMTMQRVADNARERERSGETERIMAALERAQRERTRQAAQVRRDA